MVSILATVVLLAAAIVVLTLGGLWCRCHRDGGGQRVSTGLRWTSAALTLGLTALLVPAAWRDLGRLEALFTLTIPVLCVLAAVVTDVIKRGQAVVTTLAAAAMVLWSLLHGLGPVFLYLLPGLIMIAAATASWVQPRPATASSGEAGQARSQPGSC